MKNICKKSLSLVFICLMFIIGCNQSVSSAELTNISDINANPQAYEAKEVTVAGNVAQLLKIPFVDTKMYKLGDINNSIIVLTSQDMPSEGSSLEVKGIVDNKFIISGHSFGLVLKEITRTVK